MPDIDFRVLEDRAIDVDPDIRFMALEDLRKFLTDETVTTSRSAINQSLNNLIPILLKMLNDPNPDVQNQAVKSFEPMVRYLNDDSIVKLIKKLFALVQESNNKDTSSSRTTTNFRSFTISIPNMALRSLFAQSNSRAKSDFVSDKLSMSNYKYDRELSESITNFLIPLILDNDTTIDNIELLIDLINELGYVLSQEELVKLGKYFINVGFKESGIIGKKAIVGLEGVTILIRSAVAIDRLVDEILNQVQQSKLNNKHFVLYQLYSVILKRGLKPDKIDQIYETVKLEIESSATGNDNEDLDYDLLEQSNALKEEAFTTLIDLEKQNFLSTTFKGEVLAIITKYLKYNPLHDDSDEDIDSDGYDEIDFSDDEIEAGDDSDYDNSWKLRAKATILIRSLLASFPDTLEILSRQVLPILPLRDSNDQVVIEAAKSCIAIVQATSPRDSQNVQSIGSILRDRLEDVKEEQLPLFLRIVESLNRFDNLPLIEATFDILSQRNVISSGSLDYLQFYSSVLKFHNNLNANAIERVSKDLATNLEDKSFNLILETLRGLSILFKHKDASKIPNIDNILSSLMDKVVNSKQYPSDLVRLAISCLGEALANNLVSSDDRILDVFKTSIGYEGTSKVTIDVLKNLYHLKPIPQDYSLFIIDKLTNYILSSNEATSLATLTLLDQIVHQLPARKYDDIISNLLQLLRVTSPLNYQYIFSIFNHLSNEIIRDDEYRTQLVQILIQLVNDKKITGDDEVFFQLVKAACQLDKFVYSQLEQNLSANVPITPKILAVCVDNETRDELISARSNEFRNYYTGDINSAKFAFVILFLAFSQTEVPDLSVNSLIELLQKPNFTNDANVQAASTALGLVAENDTATAIPRILDAYKQEASSSIRGSLIDSLKVLIDQCDDIQKLQIWQTVFALQVDYNHDLIPELRKSGELLGSIAFSINEAEIRQAVEGQSNQRKIYLVLVVSKSLISGLESSNTSDRLLTYLVTASINWLDIVDVDIRQIVVGNLLTGIHSKPNIILPLLNDLILPQLYKQLTAEKAFKKIITMGPYKYVLDQGLEIRKLCYEFIYSILAIDETTLDKYNINVQLIAQNIIEKGLIDDQSDIIVLACLNLLNFLDLHESQFKELIKSSNQELTDNLINGLNVQLNKKLSAKASSQETENHQERIKSIIRLSKKINTVFEALQSEFDNLGVFDAWNQYHNGIKQNFTVFYNSAKS
ncbi:TIP120 [Candida margitis]|uniref:TIP120 n=1 Tax=Candida margitis TaxID=1775924 RepID=UPI0022266B59|nr:TIP120 [Candida margitis]KAI5969076.1 TIP120 [Candida margitis]